MLKDKDIITKWEKATDALANYFVEKYFGKNASDVYWAGDEIGGVLTVNDYFFDNREICAILRLRLSKKAMFERYDNNLKQYEKMHKMQNPIGWNYV